MVNGVILESFLNKGRMPSVSAFSQNANKNMKDLQNIITLKAKNQ